MTRVRSILILGGGTMQLPAIRAAHRMGLTVIVADANTAAPGRAEADTFEHVDLADREAMLATARKYHADGRLDAVFTAGTDFSMTVAYVAESLGLPGTGFAVARNATDKFLMRSVLAAAGVRVPRFTVLGEDDLTLARMEEGVREVGLPAVVKPADSMGARGVVRVDSAEAALSQAVTSVRHSRTRRVVVEGYVDGPEFSLDALVHEGTVEVTGFADRHIAFAPFFIEMGHTIPSDLDGAESASVISEFTRGIRALGIMNGAAKGDMKLGRDGPVVGEIAARLSGGYMSGWTYPLSSGVELTEKAIRIALGEPPGSLEPKWARTSAERAIISIPGRVEAITGRDEAESAPGVAEVFISVGAGAVVTLPTSNVEKCGNVIAAADSRENAMHSAERAVARIEVLLEPDRAETGEFLFGDAQGYWAFPPDEIPPDWRRPLPFRVSESRRRGSSPVGIGRFPQRLATPDWAWRTPAETVAILEQNALVRTDRLEPKWGPVVRRAIVKGGLQGGRYAVRSLRVSP